MITQIPVDYTAQRQVSADGETFDISSADYLVANGITPEDGACLFTMSHIGALVVMDVTFTEGGTFTELSLTSETTPFIQTGTIDLTQPITLSSDGPAQGIAIDAEQTGTTVSLALGEAGEGLEIEAGQTVRFCMMVAPVNLKDPESALTLSVTDVTGMPHSASVNPRNFKQGYAYRIACALDSPEPTNLSENGTANTYIVDVDNINPGGYYFTTTVAGNGISMEEDFAYFEYQGISQVYPVLGKAELLATQGVEVIWNQNDCISDVAFDAASQTISFKATGAKGNAKVSAICNGVKHWTWLIWCTDQPGTIEFTNENSDYTFTVMDRNIGATTNGGSTDLDAMDGVRYQWGNPIPWSRDEFATAAFGNNNLTLQGALWQPTTPNGMAAWAVQWFFPDGSHGKQLYGILWGGGSLGAQQGGLDVKYHIRYDNSTTKTLYDPCPVGYKVAPYGLLAGYGRVSEMSNASADVYGIHLAGDNGGDVLLPYNGMGWFGGNGIMGWAQAGVYDPAIDNAVYLYLWTSAYNNTNVPYALCASANNATEINVTDGNLVVQEASGHAMGVRCVAE